MAVRGDTILLEPEGFDPFEVALSSVAGLEVSRGRKSNVGKGALIGGLSGLGIGLVWGLSLDRSVSDFAPGTELLYILPPPAVGASIGALAGVFTKTDRWEEVALDRLRVSVRPHDDGRVGFGLSVAF